MTTSFFVAADWLAEHIDDPADSNSLMPGWRRQGQEAPRDMAARIPRRVISPARCSLISKRFLTTPARCRT